MSEDTIPDEMLRHLTGSGFVLEKPERLGVAVSGGGDSMACLDLMIWHGQAMGFAVEAVTVDHGLRAEVAEEIALVRDFCAARGVAHSVVSWSWDGVGNLQAKARRARYELIGAWAVDRGVDCVALGHTEDDVAETFLMRLARRSGVDGLAQMEHRFERAGVRWIRPLLNFGRGVWREYLMRHGIAWAEDPSNADENFERVRARRILETLKPLGIDTDVLSEVSHNLWIAKAALNHAVYDAVSTYGVEDRGDLILPGDAPELGKLLPHEIEFRMRRAAIRWIAGADYAPRADAMIELDIGLREIGTHTLGGCLFKTVTGREIHEQRQRITREYNAVKETASSTDALWDGRWAMAGPHDAELEVRALGEAVKDCPDWRETGLPRQSLLASPSIWHGDELIAAPLAGLENGWEASATGRGSFVESLLSR